MTTATKQGHTPVYPFRLKSKYTGREHNVRIIDMADYACRVTDDDCIVETCKQSDLLTIATQGGEP